MPLKSSYQSVHSYAERLHLVMIKWRHYLQITIYEVEYNQHT